MLIHQPVREPAGICLADETSDEERDTEDQARLRDVESVMFTEDDRAGGRLGGRQS